MLFPILEVAAVEKGSLRFPLTLVNHSKSPFFFSGRGMNAAFAVGRLCDFEAGCKRMLSLKTSDIMVKSDWLCVSVFCFLIAVARF